MANRVENENKIADQAAVIGILDSVAYNRGIEIDSLNLQLFRATDNLTTCQSDRVYDKIVFQQDLKMYKRLTWVGFVTTVLVTIIKLK